MLVDEIDLRDGADLVVRVVDVPSCAACDLVANRDGHIEVMALEIPDVALPTPLQGRATVPWEK